MRSGAFRGRWLACLVAAVGLAACGGAGPGGEWDDARTERHYEDAYATWTRHGKDYEAFEGRVFMHVTYLSIPFAEALARYESARFGHLPAQAAAHAAARLAAARKETRFLVTLVTQTAYWNDFERPNGTFKAQLIDGDEGIRPASIERVSLDGAEDLRPFFPDLDALGTAYWLTFDVPPSTTPLVLRIAGAPARIDLRWERQ